MRAFLITAFIIFSAGFKRKVEEYALLTDDDRKEEGLHLVSELVQLVKTKGISRAHRVSNPLVLAAIHKVRLK